MNKKIIVLLGILGITLILAPLFVYLTSRIEHTPFSGTPYSFVSPTSILRIPTSMVNIASVAQELPAKDATGVEIQPTIAITFDHPITKQDQSLTKFSISPDVAGELQWSSDTKTLSYALTNLLQANTTYTVTVTYIQQTFSWSFKTKLYTDLSTQDQFQLQSQKEKEYATGQQAIQTQYPWYDNLPLTTTTYFVLFDTNTKRFTAKIYQSDNPGLDITSVKKDVIAALTKLGIPTAAYPIDWVIQ